MDEMLPGAVTPQHDFSLLTNHAHVLVLIAQRPDVRMREIASTIGITERAVQRIVDDLTSCGYIVVTKDGRRNRYEIQPDRPLRHPLDQHRKIGDLIRLIVPEYSGGEGSRFAAAVFGSRAGQAGESGLAGAAEGKASATPCPSSLPCPSTLAATDAPVVSEQAREELRKKLEATPAVVTHGAELRTRKEQQTGHVRPKQ